jgi:hypothetical protein
MASVQSGIYMQLGLPQSRTLLLIDYVLHTLDQKQTIRKLKKSNLSINFALDSATRDSATCFPIP